MNRLFCASPGANEGREQSLGEDEQVCWWLRSSHSRWSQNRPSLKNKEMKIIKGLWRPITRPTCNVMASLRSALWSRAFPARNRVLSSCERAEECVMCACGWVYRCVYGLRSCTEHGVLKEERQNVNERKFNAFCPAALFEIPKNFQK